MHETNTNTSGIRVINAPSILGLKPSGVEGLADALVTPDFLRQMHIRLPIIDVPTLNSNYINERDMETGCLNSRVIRGFSRSLAQEINACVSRDEFPLVFGGDCSILLGIMPGLKRHGRYGLIFLDAHADFYLPEQSPTGEVADMELALLTGRGPKQLSDIDHLSPYVAEENIIHVGQRDQAETKKWGATDLSETAITSYDLATIRKEGILNVIDRMGIDIKHSNAKGYWLHFDTDVLSDEINPAVDYRIPDGLNEKETVLLLGQLFDTAKIKGMSVTIYNPKLDFNGEAVRMISTIIVNAYKGVGL